MSQTKNLYLVVYVYISFVIFEFYDELYELYGKTEIYINMIWNIYVILYTEHENLQHVFKNRTSFIYICI